MSRIGKQPIAIPAKVKVEVKGQKVHVEGPKGKLDWELPKRTSLKVEDGKVVVNFSGNGDMSAVEALGRFLKALHTQATSLGVPEVAFDFRDLYFMNSSCFKAFVTWIDVVSRVNSNGYKIRFMTNPRLHWQRRSLEALRCLSPNVVRVEALAV